MKKIFMLLIFTFMLIGCSSVQRNSNNRALQLYKEWRLEELEKEIQYLNESEREKYKKLLDIRVDEKEKLFDEVEKIKELLSQNNIDELEKFLDLGIKQNIVLTQLKKVDFRTANIFFSELKFYNNSATNMIAINYETTTFYYEVFYILKEKEWKIKNFKEKRG